MNKVAVAALMLGSGLFLPQLRADCTLTNLGVAPLPDRAYALYQGFPGGLYPDFSNNAPPTHFTAALEIAVNQVRPLDADGNVDQHRGRPI